MLDPTKFAHIAASSAFVGGVFRPKKWPGLERWRGTA
jgi:hypothetical protein